ncbi:hypothetical protein CROQUDRAFT_661647 [Cronartium quercuum f. sp. fusiforme G11]|uniref:UBA domain-containing protein n=1 Tax=Cronartium quercuum f. sp. fusiforme G11 TaxID=708437 RepID=A0A9P6TA23_9BASI|nr:hypothetical protein CROQUDRAFT_661647 [Cronartium quercuum f. sp. fusiforme G11]
MVELNDQNFKQIKEMMGDQSSDNQILKALNLFNNNFDSALDYLLASNQHESNPSPTEELRKSISDALTTNTDTNTNTNTTIPELLDWSQNRNSWGEPPELLSPSPKGATEWNLGFESSPTKTWNLEPEPSGSGRNSSLIGTESDENREPLVLPNSPPKLPYQPMTVTGQTTPIEDFNLNKSLTRQATGMVTRSVTATNRNSENEQNQSSSIKAISQTSVPEMTFEQQMDAAIRASLESSGVQSNQDRLIEPIKELGTEDEQMSKAMEESLAMSSSRTLEDSGKFNHPSAPKRVRATGNPVGLRVQNPHLVFLPAVLVAMYAAKPFRDRILAFKPPSRPEIQDLINHDVKGLWKGESNWRSEDNWGEKPHPIETILAIQRLFAMMTHSTRSYLDVRELSLLLGYEEGEGINWSLNELNKSCHHAYDSIAETWKQLSSMIFEELSNQPGNNAEELERQYEHERRLFHWRGYRLPLPLTETEPEINKLPDNSTTCLNLETMSWTLNEIYTCIDAQVWQPEINTAHFLDGISEILAFEINRKSTTDINLNTRNNKKPFKLETEIWTDRYLYEKRYQILDLREEICKIEGEADVSLSRRDQLAKVGGKDVVETLKATVEYLSQESEFSSTSTIEREEKKRRMLPKFKAALEKLEAELESLEIKAATAQAASKAVFDIDEMKRTGPHDLCAVVVSDGFPGRDHLWTYAKADDGRWFKFKDRHISSVTIEMVLNDPAGIHLNSGHVFAIYVHRPAPDEKIHDSLNISLPPSLETAIKKDNEAFNEEILSAPTDEDPVTLSDLITGTKMEIDSPRSDVAELGEVGGVVNESEPLRLMGGAGSDDEESREDDEEEEEDLVELGFLKAIKGKLNVERMTGKIGGRPIWLKPSSPLDSQAVTCSSCGQPMAFLLQMNAPDDENPEAYLRTIYVFVCRKMSCIRLHSPGSLKAFRIQISESELSSLNESANNEPPLAKPFKEWEIVCDEEPEDTIVHLKSSIPPCIDMGSKGNEEDAKMRDTRAPVDDTFLRFQSRLARAPDQILRYLRVTEPPIEPLWANESICSPNELICSNCKSTRTAEFQIMSTLLSSLGEEELIDDSLDFGTIVIYTCTNSCKVSSYTSSSDWIEESCLIQMFSLDGMNIGRN